MKIAITGASGFLGSVLVPLLLAEGHHLRLLVRDEPGQSGDNRITYVRGDLADERSLMLFVEQVDVLIHLAALISIKDQPDEQLFHVNTEGTRLLVTMAYKAGVKRFIYLSSVTVYRQDPYKDKLDETREMLKGIMYDYAHTKALAQKMVLSHNRNGFEVLALVPTALIGPYDNKPSLLGKAIIAIYTGKIPALFPGGVDFVDVRDVAGAILAALTKGTPGKAYLLSGAWASLLMLRKQIGEISGKNIPVPVLSLPLIFALLPLVKLWAWGSGSPPLYSKQSVYNLIRSNQRIDHSLAKEALGFNPRPLSESLKDTLEWFKEKNFIK